MYLHYVGTLKELLDQITSKFNLSWRYDHESNQIEISGLKPRLLESALSVARLSLKQSLKMAIPARCHRKSIH